VLLQQLARRIRVEEAVGMNSEADLPGHYRPSCMLHRRSAPLAVSQVSPVQGRRTRSTASTERFSP
jgi:hypothetical protein